MTQKSIKLTFDNGRGAALAGVMDMPEGVPKAYGVFAPCFTCVKESHGAVKICRALAAEGLAMLRFDLTGIGQSTGDMALENFTTRVDDMVAAAQFLGADYALPQLLIGHSISGTAALSAVRQLPSVVAVATVGSPESPQAIIEKFRRLDHIQTEGDHVALMVMGTTYRFRQDFITDMEGYPTAEDTRRMDKDLFIFHAPNDAVVAFDNARIIHDRAPEKSQLIALDDTATHLFEKGAADADFIAQTLAAALTLQQP